MLGSTCVAAQLAVSREGLSSKMLVLGPTSGHLGRSVLSEP
jgi:hypothetical protein